MTTGILLINLGTPDDPSPAAVRRYLDEFLMDPLVIDIPYLARFFLVKGLILNLRPKKTSALYSKVWTDRGSPLLFHTEDLTQKLKAKLNPSVICDFGMRYGKPGLSETLKNLCDQKIDELLVIPLYPQYSLAATESSLVEVRKWVSKNAPQLRVKEVKDFFDDAHFISAFADIAKKHIEGKDFDHLVFTFHGLPERQVKKTDCNSNHCLQVENCCDARLETNRYCYRSQCFVTMKLIAQRLGLKPDQYSIGFQSRLGRTPWIRPYTDHLYDDLLRRGIKKIAVMSPSFVADCLETLEEISIRGREQFLEGGGTDFHFIPSLNSEEVWVDALSKLIQQKL